jgi:hypothetical protein
MIKIMSNAEIYNLAKILNTAFNMEERYLPARINFFIIKNKNTIMRLAEIIEESRIEIVKHYGIIDEAGMIQVPKDKIGTVNNELTELLKVSQEIEISTITLSMLDDLEFTPA